MLTIVVPGAVEGFDESAEEFKTIGDVELELEHSLVSLSKWESKFQRPFLEDQARTPEETFEYIKMMTLTPKVPEEVFSKLSVDNVETINDYVNAKMSATWFADTPGAPKTSEKITSELIYYWMTVFQIDWEAQHWHLNRLFTLIRICNIKQAKPKKMTRAQQAAEQRRLNADRRAAMGTRG